MCSLRKVATLVIIAFYVLGPAPAAAGGLLTPGEQQRFDEVVARLRRVLVRMDHAARSHQPDRYYATMKNCLTSTDDLPALVRNVQQRLTEAMTLIAGRNLRLGLGTDPKSWPAADRDAYDKGKHALEQLPRVIKADAVFRANLRSRLEIAAGTRFDQDVFDTNENNWRRDVGLLQGCLDALSSAVHDI